MGALLQDDKIEKRIVASTSQGKYTIRSYIPRWDPKVEWFKNHYLIAVDPIRPKFKGKSYGSSIKYLIEFKDKEGKGSIVPIHPKDFRLKKFKHFQLTEESLESKEKLSEFLSMLKKEGIILAESVSVHDLEEYRKELFENYRDDVWEAEKVGFLEFKIKGRFLTYLDRKRLQRENNKRQKKLNANKADQATP